MQNAVKHLSPVKDKEEEEGEKEEEEGEEEEGEEESHNLIFCLILVLVCMATKRRHHLKQHFSL